MNKSFVADVCTVQTCSNVLRSVFHLPVLSVIRIFSKVISFCNSDITCTFAYPTFASFYVSTQSTYTYLLPYLNTFFNETDTIRILPLFLSSGVFVPSNTQRCVIKTLKITSGCASCILIRCNEC
jgi:hypothetical protein